MLEVPVAFVVERYQWPRRWAALIAGLIIAGISTTIILDFDTLFGLVITVSTRYGQPLLGLMICLFAGWVWHRDSLLRELQKNDAGAANTWFWRIWPLYVKVVCPIIVAVILIRSVL
jgi:NSS family neurotransmitter:Na+ symporter